MTDGSQSREPAVKLLAALIYRENDALEECLDVLGGTFSPLDYRGPRHPFDRTDYYREEMGAGLSRVLASFRGLISPLSLADAKLKAGEIEGRFRVEGQRRINVDVGYLDLFKVVLASRKERGQKFYLGQGIWADLTLTYANGKFHPLPWSFPDFASGAYDGDLLAIRGLYKEELRTLEPLEFPGK